MQNRSLSVPFAAAAPQPDLRDRYREFRALTESLAAPLSAEDCALQSMPDASPTKWHLAHTNWFFETFVLEPQGVPAFDPAYRVLFNSYYNAVGERHPRPQRGLLSRPGLEEVLAYRRHIDDRMQAMLDRGDISNTALHAIVELGLHHEQQHQELMLTDLKHLFSCNPLRPAYVRGVAAVAVEIAPLTWHRIDGGIRCIGHAGDGFCFDNELPRHRIVLPAFELASRLVTSGEYLEFIDAGGYARPALWLSDGWDTVVAQGWQAPQYWEKRDDRWFQFTLSGMRAIDPAEPVCHVSYYEADAYARWAGARLPREAEWENAADGLPIEGHFLDAHRFHPPAIEHRSHPPGQMYGDVWEWTQSPYVAYPGYTPPAGAIGE